MPQPENLTEENENLLLSPINNFTKTFSDLKATGQSGTQVVIVDEKKATGQTVSKVIFKEKATGQGDEEVIFKDKSTGQSLVLLKSYKTIDNSIANAITSGSLRILASFDFGGKSSIKVNLFETNEQNSPTKYYKSLK